MFDYFYCYYLFHEHIRVANILTDIQVTNIIVTYLLTAGRADPGRTAIARRRQINILPLRQLRHPIASRWLNKQLSATEVTSRNNKRDVGGVFCAIRPGAI